MKGLVRIEKLIDFKMTVANTVGANVIVINADAETEAQRDKVLI